MKCIIERQISGPHKERRRVREIIYWRKDWRFKRQTKRDLSWWFGQRNWMTTTKVLHLRVVLGSKATSGPDRALTEVVHTTYSVVKLYYHQVNKKKKKKQPTITTVFWTINCKDVIPVSKHLSWSTTTNQRVCSLLHLHMYIYKYVFVCACRCAHVYIARQRNE